MWQPSTAHKRRQQLLVGTVSQTVPISESVPYSGKPKECCGGVAVEQERLQGLWSSAFGALTPGLGILVLLTLDPEGHSNVDNGRDNEVR